MISFDATSRIYVGLEAIDFRCGLNKLIPLARTCFNQDPKGQSIFAFRNRRRTDIKILLFDRNGFFLGHKRFSRGTLQWWPRTEQECLSLNAEQLLKLLAGVDPRGSFHPSWANVGGQIGKDSNRSGDPRYRGAEEAPCRGPALY